MALVFSRRPASENAAFFKRISLFETLVPKDLEALSGIAHERSYLKDEIVFDEGEEGLGIYFIKEGEISIEKRDGSNRRLALLTKGEFFGELALLDGVPRSATAVASQPSVLLGIFRPDFMNLVQDHRRVGIELSLALARLTAKRLRETLKNDPAFSSL